MRSIYLKNPNTLRFDASKPTNLVECPSCGGPKVIYPVGWTLGDKPVYGCKDPWHKKTVRQAEL